MMPLSVHRTATAGPRNLARSTNARRFADDEIPYFSWDRVWSVAEIRRRLATCTGAAWSRVAAWILRETAFRDVWQFLKPRAVWERYGELEPLLGRKREFWTYILGTWRELGRL